MCSEYEFGLLGVGGAWCSDREVKGKGEEKAKSSSKPAKAQPQNLTAISCLTSCGLAGPPLTEMWGKCCTDHLVLQ
jgi:hypothetical protein